MEEVRAIRTVGGDYVTGMVRHAEDWGQEGNSQDTEIIRTMGEII